MQKGMERQLVVLSVQGSMYGHVAEEEKSCENAFHKCVWGNMAKYSSRRKGSEA